MIDAIQWQSRTVDAVIERINLAFPPTSPPDDLSLVAAKEDHLRKCDECRDAKEYFTGKTREVILDDEQNYPHLVNAFDFFTPQAWHYYLPVFLIQDLLRRRQSYNHFWHHEYPGLIENLWVPRIELLTGQQCETLLDYFEYWKPYAIVLGRTDELRKVREWWQIIHQEKVAANLDRI